jgi:hypothetical protein
VTSENSPSKVAASEKPFCVDDEGRARQGLEGGGDIAVGIEVVRPRKAAAQSEGSILHRE